MRGLRSDCCMRFHYLDWSCTNKETGSIAEGFFILAKNLGLVPRIRPLIEELTRKRFRISDRIVSEALIRAGE